MRNVHIGAFYARLETTPGVESLPVASTDAIAILEPLAPQPTPASYVGRENLVQGTTLNSGRRLRPSAFSGTWPLSVHVRGTRNGLAFSASNLPELHALYMACGFSSQLVTTPGGESYTVRPAATGLQSVTAHYWQDGLLHKLVGAVGQSFALSFDAGGPLLAAISLFGVAPKVTAFAAPVGNDFGSSLPPVAEAVNLTLGGVDAGIVRRFALNVSHTAAARPSTNAPSALAAPRIRKRTITGELVLEEPLLSVRDFEQLHREQTLVPLAWALGAASGVAQYNRVAFTAAAVQIGTPSRSSDNGTPLLTLPLELVDSSPEAADAVIIGHS